MDKSRIVIILAALVLILLILNIGSCVNAQAQNSNRKKEMFQRMELEEKMTKAAQDNLSASEKAKGLQKQLEEEAAAHQATKKALTQEQLVNSSLKEDLQKLVKINDALEEELKKAVSSTKKAKK